MIELLLTFLTGFLTGFLAGLQSMTAGQWTLFIGLLANAFAVWWAMRRVVGEVHKIEVATNSMKDALVSSTRHEADAVGYERGRTEGEDKANVLAEGQRLGREAVREYQRDSAREYQRDADKPLPVADAQALEVGKRVAGATEKLADAAEKSADAAVTAANKPNSQ